MKTTVIALALLLCAGTSSAQTGGLVGLYSDAYWSDCNLSAAADVMATVYVVHSSASQANGLQFRVISNWDNFTVANVVYGGNVAVGDLFTGVSVTYGACRALPYLVATLTFVPLDTPPSCSILRVIGDPASETGQVEVIDCSFQKLTAYGSYLCVNTSPPCCTIGGPDPGCELPVATDETTWGEIKALYR
jgi:hypothetical protein